MNLFSSGAYFLLEQSGHDVIIRARVDGRLLLCGYAVIALILIIRWLRAD